MTHDSCRKVSIHFWAGSAYDRAIARSHFTLCCPWIPLATASKRYPRTNERSTPKKRWQLSSLFMFLPLLL
ncbi:hypothetical protein QUA30_20185 [Microcoleus sp. Pol14C2]|uniref:hypothetical protein n=1 Tax=unclassified Microcoleus TaxID=2642155 RepID=UPI002FCF41CB